MTNFVTFSVFHTGCETTRKVGQDRGELALKCEENWYLVNEFPHQDETPAGRWT